MGRNTPVADHGPPNPSLPVVTSLQSRHDHFTRRSLFEWLPGFLFKA